MGSDYEVRSRTVSLTLDLAHFGPNSPPRGTLEIASFQDVFSPAQQAAVQDNMENGTYLHDVHREVPWQYLPPIVMFDSWGEALGAFIRAVPTHPEPLFRVLDGPEAVVPVFGSPPEGWLKLGELAPSVGTGFFLITASVSPWLAVLLGFGVLVVVRFGTPVLDAAAGEAARWTKYKLRTFFNVPDDFDQ
ncbi:hypothetical protein [Streptomyces sp. NPDC056056]|uniref:hypothetical protein n=1 Tax=Streptomyces sp. NPDC056056 TaxID=3345698 RepID=UPI0035D72E0C